MSMCCLPASEHSVSGVNKEREHARGEPFRDISGGGTGLCG